MSDESPRDQLGAQVRTMQIIVFALCTGVLMFGGFVLSGGREAEPEQSNILTLATICFAVLGGAMSLVVPRTIAAAQRRKIADGTWQPANQRSPVPDTDAGKLVVIYQLKTILSAALLEAPTFLALTAYMTEGHIVSLGIAAVLLLGLMAHFPTLGRVEAWVEGQLRRVEEQRQFST